MQEGPVLKYLVAFGTVAGHTRRIADTIAQQIIDAQHQAVLHDASQRARDPAVRECDACIIAAPVHQQRHPEAIINFATANAERLNAMSSALVSVSISAAFADGREEAQSYVDRLLATTGWKPAAIHLAAGALRYTDYDFFQEQIIRHVVLKDRAVDNIRGDHDFTDWQKLAAFVDQFIGRK